LQRDLEVAQLRLPSHEAHPLRKRAFRRRHHGTWLLAAAYRRLERRVLRENRRVEFLQRFARFDTELLDEHFAGLAVEVERGGLAARSVQREHELAPGPFPRWFLRNKSLQLSDHQCVATAVELCLDTSLERGNAELVKSPRARMSAASSYRWRG
jgi:hypothetical protein